MIISYSYDKLKVLQALRYHFINKKDIKYLLIAINIVAIVAGVLTFLKKVQPPVFILTSFMWVILMLVFWLVMPRLIYGKTRAFKDSFITTINAEEIILQTEQGSRTWNLSQFSNWFESPYFFHLYVSANSFFIIPKDNISEAEQQEARIFFNNKIKKQ